MVSPVIENSVREILTSSLGVPIYAIRFSPVAGGDINTCFRVFIDDGFSFFCKSNSAKAFPQLFEKEMNGLRLLEAQGIFRIPKIIGCCTAGDHQVLVLEWINSGRQTATCWKIAGEHLARMHRATQETFGLYENNYMGCLPQSNAVHTDWVAFFISERLEPQVRMAIDKGLLDASHDIFFKNLYKRLGDFFPPEQPALLHGDLWSGNLLADDNDRPVLIDPAVYFGHRAADLAMTTLFGGFGTDFYTSYHYHFPLPANYRQQWEYCNLYPLLVHLNVFGRSYLPRILATIKRV